MITDHPTDPSRERAAPSAWLVPVLTLTTFVAMLQAMALGPHLRDGNRLDFSTIGEGYLGASTDGSLQHGTVMWRVNGGEGPFAGASGLITSNFFVDGSGAVTDHQFGVLFVE